MIMGIIIRMKGKAVKTKSKLANRIFDDIQIGAVDYAKTPREAHGKMINMARSYPFVKDKEFIVHRGSRIEAEIDGIRMPFDTGSKNIKWKKWKR